MIDVPEQITDQIGDTRQATITVEEFARAIQGGMDGAVNYWIDGKQRQAIASLQYAQARLNKIQSRLDNVFTQISNRKP